MGGLWVGVGERVRKGRTQIHGRYGEKRSSGDENRGRREAKTHTHIHKRACMYVRARTQKKRGKKIGREESVYSGERIKEG